MVFVPLSLVVHLASIVIRHAGPGIGSYYVGCQRASTDRAAGTGMLAGVGTGTVSGSLGVGSTALSRPLAPCPSGTPAPGADGASQLQVAH